MPPPAEAGRSDIREGSSVCASFWAKASRPSSPGCKGCCAPTAGWETAASPCTARSGLSAGEPWSLASIRLQPKGARTKLAASAHLTIVHVYVPVRNSRIFASITWRQDCTVARRHNEASSPRRRPVLPHACAGAHSVVRPRQRAHREHRWVENGTRPTKPDPNCQAATPSNAESKYAKHRFYPPHSADGDVVRVRLFDQQHQL